MPSEQWKTGLITLTNASQIVIGSASCDWLNQLSAGHVLKRNEDNESTYTIATILTATRLLLSANYAGSTGTGLSYMACRSFSVNRGYWRPLQGDSDWAEIFSQETVDKIDTDIQNLSASLNRNASNMAAFTSDVLIANASIDALQTNMVNANASLGALQTNVVNANASLGALQTNVVNANASLGALQTNVVNANASLGDLQTSIESVLRTEKITVTHSDLTLSASQYIKVYRASPGDTIFNAFANITAGFKLGASIERTKMSFGDGSNPAGLCKQITATPIGWKWMTETNAFKGDYFYNASRNRVPKNYVSGGDVKALFTASDMFLASLDTGSVDFYIDIISRS